MSSEFHTYLWWIYCLGACGMVYLSWHFSRKIGNLNIRLALVGLIASLLLVPWTAIPEQPRWAPALIILLIEGVLSGGNIWRGLLPIVVVYGLILIALIANYWLQRRFDALKYSSGKADSGVIRSTDMQANKTDTALAEKAKNEQPDNKQAADSDTPLSSK